VLYGFPASVQQQYRKSMGSERFTQWLQHMLGVLLTQPGVEYVGSVDHARLAAEYAAAGFVLYPTAFAETGCITILKAMSCGAVPITSRFVGSVLPNLTAGWDLGPARQLQFGDDLGHWLLHDYVPAVLQAVNASIDMHRADMIKHARTRHLWSLSAKILEREMSGKGVTRGRRRKHLFFWWL
jgi:glycosyltransferase involved in cell wall biosynthesis